MKLSTEIKVCFEIRLPYCYHRNRIKIKNDSKFFKKKSMWTFFMECDPFFLRAWSNENTFLRLRNLFPWNVSIKPLYLVIYRIYAQSSIQYPIKISYSKCGGGAFHTKFFRSIIHTNDRIRIITKAKNSTLWYIYVYNKN